MKTIPEFLTFKVKYVFARFRSAAPMDKQVQILKCPPHEVDSAIRAALRKKTGHACIIKSKTEVTE